MAEQNMQGKFNFDIISSDISMRKSGNLDNKDDGDYGDGDDDLKMMLPLLRKRKRSRRTMISRLTTCAIWHQPPRTPEQARRAKWKQKAGRCWELLTVDVRTSYRAPLHFHGASTALPYA